MIHEGSSLAGPVRANRRDFGPSSMRRRRRRAMRRGLPAQPIPEQEVDWGKVAMASVVGLGLVSLVWWVTR